MTIDIDQEAPDFTLRNQHGEDIVLSSFRGDRAVVLTFFPYAFSSICTEELGEIRDRLPVLTADGVEVLAVSCDHFFSNRAYSDRYDYGFSILSDFWPHGEVARAYGTFNESVGVPDRGTYIIDKAGIVRWKVEKGIGDTRDIADYLEVLASFQ